MEVKKCIKCGKELPLTIECFGKSKANRDGFRGECKQCKAIIDRVYREKNKEKLSEHVKEYNKNNRDKANIRSRKYIKTHKGEIAEHKSNYYQENKKLITNRNNKYREENKEKITIYSKKYTEEHKEQIKENTIKWRHNNPEKCVIQGQIRRAKIRKLPFTLTISQWELIKQHFNNCCAYCGKKLPLAQEHFIPLNKGGEYTHNNIIPSCKICNSSKGVRNFFEWYPKSRSYSKKREKMILEYLNYKNGIQQLKIM